MVNAPSSPPASSFFADVTTFPPSQSALRLDPVISLRRARSFDPSLPQPPASAHYTIEHEMMLQAQHMQEQQRQYGPYVPQYAHNPGLSAQQSEQDYVRYTQMLSGFAASQQQEQEVQLRPVQAASRQSPITLQMQETAFHQAPLQAGQTSGLYRLAPSAPHFGPLQRPTHLQAPPQSQHDHHGQPQLQHYHQQQQQARQVQQQAPLQRRSEPHHRVYTLRCSHCDSFLSDRGMRAVLLLKPHITLFSTDANPVNCGPLYSSNDAEPVSEGEKVERTCECLTQSMGCHCCGNTIGYQIIAPCARCTASVTKNSRPANGHRFVFHHNEVTFRERKFHPSEQGVRTDLVRHGQHQPRTGRASPAPTATPPQPHSLDLARTADGDVKDSQLSLAPSQQVPSRSASPMPVPRSPVGLQEGDTIYWHYLISAGELATPSDPRSRTHTSHNVGR